MFEEPIRILNSEQAAELKASSNGAPAAGPQDDTTKLGRRVWNLALAGNTADQIAERLKIPLEQLHEALSAYRTRLGFGIYHLLDNERLERLLSRWLPIALGGPITIQKVKNGEVFREPDFDRPLEAGKFVLQILNQRIKTVAGAPPSESSIPGSTGGKEYGERQIAIWIKEAMPSIERVIRDIDAEEVAK